MDPFSIVGASAAIAQFVELGFKILTHSRDAYKSVDGISARYVVLLSLTLVSRLDDCLLDKRRHDTVMV